MNLYYYSDEEIMCYVCGFMDVTEQSLLERALQEDNDLAIRVFRYCADWRELQGAADPPVTPILNKEREWERQIRAFIATQSQTEDVDSILKLDGRKNRYFRLQRIDFWVYLAIGLLSIVLIILLKRVLSGF